MKALSGFNARLGLGTVTFASMRHKPGWKLRTEFIGPWHTMVREELLELRL